MEEGVKNASNSVYVVCTQPPMYLCICFLKKRPYFKGVLQNGQKIQRMSYFYMKNRVKTNFSLPHRNRPCHSEWL